MAANVKASLTSFQNLNPQSDSPLSKLPAPILENTLQSMDLQSILSFSISCKKHFNAFRKYVVLSKTFFIINAGNPTDALTNYQVIRRIHNLFYGRCQTKKISHENHHRLFAVYKGMVIADSTELKMPSNLQHCRVWDLNLGKHMFDLNEHSQAITCMEIVDGKVFSASVDATCQMADLKTRKTEFVFEGHIGQISNLKIFEKKLVTRSLDNTCRVWDIDTKTLLLKISIPSGKSNFLEVANGVIVTCTTNQNEHTFIETWNLESGQKLSKNEIKDLKAINHLKISNDKIIILGSTLDHRKICQIRDIKTNRLLNSIKPDNNQYLASPNCLEIFEDKIIVGGYDTCHILDSSLRPLLTLNDKGARFHSIKVIPGMLISGSDKGECKIWDLTSGKCIKVFSEHSKDAWRTIEKVEYDLEKDLLITTTWDSTYIRHLSASPTNASGSIHHVLPTLKIILPKNKKSSPVN